jgi:opacity protein-like surface antigen
MGVTGNVKKLLPSTDAKIVPSIEAGLGVLIDDTKNDNDDNSSSMLTVIGAGVDYVLSDNVSVGAHGYINNSFDLGHKEFFFTALVGLNIRLY